MPTRPVKKVTGATKNDNKNKKRKRPEEDGEERSKKRQKTGWLRDIKAILRSASNIPIEPQQNFNKTKNKKEIKTNKQEKINNVKVLKNEYECKIAKEDSCGLQKVEYKLNQNDIRFENIPKKYLNDLEEPEKQLSTSISDNKSEDALGEVKVDDDENLIEVDTEWMNNEKLMKVAEAEADHDDLPDYDTLQKNTFNIELDENRNDTEEIDGVSSKNEFENFYFGNECSLRCELNNSECGYMFAKPGDPNATGNEYGHNNNNSSSYNCIDDLNTFIQTGPSINDSDMNILNDSDFWLNETESGAVGDSGIGAENEIPFLVNGPYVSASGDMQVSSRPNSMPKAYYDSKNGAYVDPSSLNDVRATPSETIKRTWGSIRNIISMVSGQKSNCADTKDSNNEEDANQSYKDVQY